METIILVIHLIIALAIIALVLVQRSSGGGLGLGGGGGMGDFATARGTANTLTKMTTYCAFAFFCTSLTLAYMATRSVDSSVLDSLEEGIPAVEAVIEQEEPAEPTVPLTE